MNPFRCTYCGKFIAEKDFDDKKATIHMGHTSDQCYCYHNQCKQQEAQDDTN